MNTTSVKKRTNKKLAPNSPCDRPADWTFMTNHSHVLICLAADPQARLRDVAVKVGITERAVQKIVADLEEAKVLTREKHGRRNHYRIHPHKPLRHPVEAHRRVQDLLLMVAQDRSRMGRS